MNIQMKIAIDYPPNFDEIDAAFHVKNKAILYAYGDTIFNPMDVEIPRQLFAHEAVHGARQGDDIDGWWRRYIDDPQFRLDEEIAAHRVEYLTLIENARNRNERRGALKVIAGKLSAPLYGGLVTPAKAKSLLKAA